jgi:hypothetical protein
MRLLVSLSFDTLLSQVLVLLLHFTSVVAFPNAFELGHVLAHIRRISLASVCQLPVIAGGALETSLDSALKFLVLQQVNRFEIISFVFAVAVHGFFLLALLGESDPLLISQQFHYLLDVGVSAATIISFNILGNVVLSFVKDYIRSGENLSWFLYLSLEYHILVCCALSGAREHRQDLSLSLIS